jgi:tetratricopeptide (TPR) repeat protein
LQASNPKPRITARHAQSGAFIKEKEIMIVNGCCLKRARALSLLISLLLLSGCATKIPITMLIPGNYHQAATVKTIAVLPFSGPQGENFASEIEAVLTNIEVQGRPYFTLVDRAQINKVLSELKLSQSGLIDQTTATRAGMILGAQGIYTGTTIADTKDSFFKQKRSECARYEVRRDKDGNLSKGSCLRWNNYYVQCTKRVASFSTTPKLISVSSGRVLYSKTISRQVDSSGCEDLNPPKGEAELMEKAKESIKSEFRKDVAPYYKTVEVTLLDSTDNIDAGEAKSLLKSGLEFAEKKRLDSACAQWARAKPMAPNSVALNYNLAVCAEATADYTTALRLYKEAERLNGKIDENISLGIVRSNQAIENQKKLTEQLKD